MTGDVIVLLLCSVSSSPFGPVGPHWTASGIVFDPPPIAGCASLRSADAAVTAAASCFSSMSLWTFAVIQFVDLLYVRMILCAPYPLLVPTPFDVVYALYPAPCPARSIPGDILYVFQATWGWSTSRTLHCVALRVLRRVAALCFFVSTRSRGAGHSVCSRLCVRSVV